MNFKILIAALSMLVVHVQVAAQEVSLNIHLRGVYTSKVSLQTVEGGSIKTIAENPVIRKGEIGTLKVSKEQLPAAFVLRFDYKEKENSDPYPSERQIFINSQDIDMWVNPLYVNNPDSTWFQKGEKENALFAQFSKENTRKKEKLGLLQNFLMGYDQPQSAFYQSGVEEYEKRRRDYNAWVIAQAKQYQDVFASHAFIFQYLPQIAWKGTEAERLQSLIASYFEGMDFKDPVLAKTTDLKDWMNQYVNIYGSMATTEALRDSLFTLAGQRAIEKARMGHPVVYGWMVDYFYNGYESFNITPGIKMLEPYLNDPRCLTSKRLAIEKRLKGIETLVPGAVSPDFMLKDEAGKSLAFHKYKTSARYKLLLFWSASCHHCTELVSKLHPWQQQTKNKELADVLAISLDETETEIPVWEKAKRNLPGWKHSRAEGGINSPEASAYYVLSTPTMVLVDAKTNKIVALPATIDQLNAAMD
ncbi:TlpA family protein disulfide reductase [Pontibacter silvestris]|uniref:TlpA family protein disulfide reductase n=1 Tax=Pontibacter silvestris TaxID=2305183 RepID=A0ABW4WYW7_9BACT|nr:thioredoxin-like domain-containing protein [Pontibacter silvestris]MCC9138724.1 thioredoxin family protein [Pontibacter silvestris]